MSGSGSRPRPRPMAGQEDWPNHLADMETNKAHIEAEHYRRKQGWTLLVVACLLVGAAVPVLTVAPVGGLLLATVGGFFLGNAGMYLDPPRWP